MKHFSRPFGFLSSLVMLAGCASWLAMAPPAACGQAQQLTPIFEDQSTHAAAPAPGYLGVDIANVDADKVQALKLRDARGAVITLIDHDAPAGQTGLRVNDVVLQVNGQDVENAEQFRRMLKGWPAGSKVTLEFSRDGSLQTVTVELVDRKLMEQKVWSNLGSVSDVQEMGILSGDSAPSGFHFPSFGSTLKVGALVEPLTTQMAAYLGVESGLMVKQVARKSAAAIAGLRAFDVILKVGPDAISTSADWERALRTSHGKPVQLTILRDRKQQTLTLEVGGKHTRGALNRQDDQDPFGRLDCQRLSELDENLAGLGAQIAAWGLDQQTREQMARQMEQFRQQMEQFREAMETWDAFTEGRLV